MSVPDIVREAIAQQLDREPCEIGEGAELQELGFESLDVIETVFVLEEKLGIDLPFNANSDGADMVTVRDVITMVEAAVASRKT